MRSPTSSTEVACCRLEQKGRGRALRAAWSASRAAVVAYMDVDLSTDLHALLPLLAPLLSGHSEVAIGSRLARGSRVRAARSASSSRATYNHILRSVLRARFTDAQCGFKAVRGRRARRAARRGARRGLVLRHRAADRARSAGVCASTRSRSTGSTIPTRASTSSRTALADLRGVARLAIDTPVARFVAIGVVSTLAYALLFLALAGTLGSAVASAVALALTAVGKHRGEPAPDVRDPRPRWPCSPARRRVPRVPARTRAHERVR